MNTDTISATQSLLNAALETPRQILGEFYKSDFVQFATAKTPKGRTVDVEVHSNAVVDDAARAAGRVTEFKVTRTTFWVGSRRISRKEAEDLLRRSGE